MKRGIVWWIARDGTRGTIRDEDGSEHDFFWRDGVFPTSKGTLGGIGKTLGGKLRRLKLPEVGERVVFIRERGRITWTYTDLLRIVAVPEIQYRIVQEVWKGDRLISSNVRRKPLTPKDLLQFLGNSPPTKSKDPRANFLGQGTIGKKTIIYLLESRTVDPLGGTNAWKPCSDPRK
jgi:hypothetical protein